MSNLKEILEKNKELRSRKTNLLTEIEELKKRAEARAITLQNEVSALREEAKSLKNIMDQENSKQ